MLLLLSPQLLMISADKGKYCAALFEDLTKAFDTVEHALLTLRLGDVGFACNPCNWFKYYLSHRQQFVTAGSYLILLVCIQPLLP